LATWDVFRSDRLEIERGLSTEAVRTALARGELHDDDLIRPAGTSAAWARLADLPTLADADAEAEAEADTELPPGPPHPDVIVVEDEDEFEDVELESPAGTRAATQESGLSRLDLNLPVGKEKVRFDLSSVELVRWDQDEPEADPLVEDEEAAAFTLSRDAPEKVEELDLAAMVDVAFQLVLFFLVTSATVLYKSLEVPRPNPEAPAAGAVQGKAHSLDDLKNDYILVEIDAGGVMKIDHEPVGSELPVLVERLRSARETTGRKAMLLSADAATPHRNAVLAYDAANEIGLGIAIARPVQAGARK
jgi:biopolymer transport protein ExbD